MPNYSRQIRDAHFDQEQAFPAANADNATAGFELEAEKGAAEPDLFECELRIPALPNNTDDTKTVTLTLEDSEDGESYAPVDPRIQALVPGVASTGSAARTVRFRLPSRTRRFIRIAAAVEADGGDNTAASYGFALIF